MNLSTVDLNLFVVLDAVLATGSATRAAAQLHVTQSAVSNALARLRRTLGDPLVVRTRRGLAPTPRAAALRPHLTAALTALGDITSSTREFSLATTDRQWVIACAEHYGPLLLPGLLAQMRTVAPRAHLRIVTLEHFARAEALETGEVDLYIGIPSERPETWRSEPLFSDHSVCILRRGHPATRGRLTPARYAALPHLQTRISPQRGREIDVALARAGLTRDIALVTPYFSALPAIVASSDCVAALSRRQAEHYAAHLPLAIRDIPLDLPALDVAMHWHARADRDPAVTALRALVRDQLGATSRASSRKTSERGYR